MLDVVLHEPLIPNNAGNIGRTCVALGATLHLIHPLGFSLDEKARRRAGLDYWPRLRVREHRSWDEYAGNQRPERTWLFTTRAAKSLFDARFRPGDHLVFGNESAGLPSRLLERYPDRLIALPMLPGERSLNVATAVCAGLYEALRQLLASGHTALDDHGRIRPLGVPVPPQSPGESMDCL